MLPYDFATYRTGGDYWYGATPSGTTAATAQTTGVQHFIPVRFDTLLTIKSIGVEATAIAATAIARVGVYRDAGIEYARPGELIAELTSTSTLDVSAAGFPNSSPVTAAIDRVGLFWLSIVNQTAAATLRTFSGIAAAARLSHGTTEPAAAGTVVALTKTGITGALADVAAGDTLASVVLAPWLYFQVD